MQQLLLDLAAPEPPSFENYLPGPNAEAVSALQRFARGELPETGLLLWGGDGVGKTHLLDAAVRAAAASGVSVGRVDVATLMELPADGWTESLLMVIDDVHAATPAAQATLFTLFNRLRDSGRHLLLGSRLPPAGLPFREDIRTRLGWGLVYELQPLADADKPAALLEYARRRGFALSDDVIRYLLAHSRRDMRALCANLAALDRESLVAKRAITVPLLRDWLQRQMQLTQ